MKCYEQECPISEEQFFYKLNQLIVILSEISEYESINGDYDD